MNRQIIDGKLKIRSFGLKRKRIVVAFVRCLSSTNDHVGLNFFCSWIHASGALYGLKYGYNSLSFFFFGFFFISGIPDTTSSLIKLSSVLNLAILLIY